ncbi:MAG: hypothetical protein AAB567_01255 [Patescibacteria group bacterium]
MTKHQRIVLLLSLTLVFFLATPTLILYSQGYRIDWKAKRITQVGAFYLKITPSRVNVFVDGKLEDTTSLISDISVVENLIPQRYAIQVSKDGYHPWKKTLEIHPKHITSAKNILLIPSEIKTRTLASRVQKFWIAPHGREAILQKMNSEGEWKLTKWDLEKHSEYKVFEPKTRKENLWNLQWSPSGDAILLEINAGETIHRSITQFNSKTSYDLEFLGRQGDEIRFLPGTKDTILFIQHLPTSSILMEANYTTKSAVPVGLGNVVTFALEDNEILWLDTKGFIWRKKMGFNSSSSALNTQPFPVHSETKYEILLLNKRVFLKENEKVFQLNDGTKNFQETSSSALYVSLSPDEKKIAFSDGSEIWISYLENQNEQPQRKKGEKVFLTRVSQPIENVSWLDSHHLLFSVGDTIKVAEIDDRDTINIVDVLQMPKPQFFWQPENKIFYILSEGKFSVSEKLIR